MNKTDVFYTILLKLEFFSHFFYQQYLLDFTNNIAEDIKNNTTQSLTSFYKHYPIKEYLRSTTEITYLENDGILIKTPAHLEYAIVLYMNRSLDFVKTSPLPLTDASFLNETSTRDLFLYKNTTQPIYIVFFRFYSSLNLSNPNASTLITKTLKESLEESCCYFQHHQYNCYSLLFSGLDDITIFQYCLALNKKFVTIKNPYLNPKFLVAEYLNDEPFDEFITKIKNYFLNFSFEEDCIIKKMPRILKCTL